MPRTCDACQHGDEKRGIKPLLEQTRQTFACPYAPVPPEQLLPYVRPPIPPAYSGDELTVCPGYSSSLPEVIEGARAWRHWEKADVRAFTGGAWPTPGLTLAIESFDAAVSQHQRWCLDNPVKKTGEQ